MIWKARLSLCKRIHYVIIVDESFLAAERVMVKGKAFWNLIQT